MGSATPDFQFYMKVPFPCGSVCSIDSVGDIHSLDRYRAHGMCHLAFGVNEQVNQRVLHSHGGRQPKCKECDEEANDVLLWVMTMAMGQGR